MTYLTEKSNKLYCYFYMDMFLKVVHTALKIEVQVILNILEDTVNINSIYQPLLDSVI